MILTSLLSMPSKYLIREHRSNLANPQIHSIFPATLVCMTFNYNTAKHCINTDAAKVILDKDLNYFKLNNTINEIIKDRQKLIEMGKNAYKVAKPEVEDKIYEEIRKSLKNT